MTSCACTPPRLPSHTSPIASMGSSGAPTLQAELYLRASGLDYTIVRPGGLSAEPPEQVGSLVVRGEDTLFGLPGDPGRSISRITVRPQTGSSSGVGAPTG